MIGWFVMRGSRGWFRHLTKPTWRPPYTRLWWVDNFCLIPMVREYQAAVAREIVGRIHPRTSRR